jgi:mannose-6-phosphate isomerase-like protein (cupin superfamily)
MSSIAIVISAHAYHATSAVATRVTSAEATRVTSAKATDVTSAKASHGTSAEATHGTSAETATATVSAAATAAATATAACLCTRRKQRPGKQGGRQYHHRPSSSHYIFLSTAGAASDYRTCRLGPDMAARRRIANGKSRRQ